MSESSIKGKSLENDIARLLRSKLGVKVARDKKSGAGINKSDINDYWREIPLFIEAKNQKTIKIKEFYKQAKGGASMGQIPTVVFAVEDEEVLACLPFEALVNLLVEIKDYKEEVALLRSPVHITDKAEIVSTSISNNIYDLEYKPQTSHKECREGHLSDKNGYCQQKTCKYSRSYRPPKGKK